MYLILGVGAALRLVQYLIHDSLWIDELFIALNVTRRGWWELLFEPLDYYQVAPIGFLALEKLATSLLGSSELSLRLFPTLFSLVSMVLFWRVCRRFLEGRLLLVALALFAINPVALFTARTVKQYSGDVMVALLLILLALRFREGKDDVRSSIIGGVVGALAILLSHPGVLVGACLFAVLLFQRLRARAPLRPVMLLGAAGTLGALAVTLASLILTPRATWAFMREGWRKAFAAGLMDDPLSMPRLLFEFVAYYLGAMKPNNPPEAALTAVFFALALFGGWRLARNRPGSSALLVTPLVVVIGAAALHVLPFSTRVSAFAGSVILIALAAGLAIPGSALPGWAGKGLFAFAVCLSAAPAIAQLFLNPPMYPREYTRPILEKVRGRWRSGDVLYPFYPGRWAVEFYGEPMGLVPWVRGEPHETAPREYLEEVDRFRGQTRTWFFFTDTRRCSAVATISYLDAIGTRVEAIQDRAGNRRGAREAAAFLYDLSDTARLERSSPVTHSLPSMGESCGPATTTRAQDLKRKLRRLLSGFSS